MTSTADRSDEALADAVRAALAERGLFVEVTGIVRLTAGASRQTYRVDVTHADGRRGAVVLRRDPPGYGAPDRMATEAACLQAAAAWEVPVPRVLASGSQMAGTEAAFMVTEHVDGETLPRNLLRSPRFADVRASIATELGRVLARLHRVDLTSLPMLDDTDALTALEATYRNLNRPSPAAELGFSRLRSTPVRTRPKALVHGDFRVGNLIIDESGLCAVLDWELAHIGNPIEDLGWLCVPAWRFGSRLPVGGMGTRSALLDGYEQESGERPSDAELAWWELFGTLKWLVLAVFQADRHLSGAEQSIELAAVGRRVCEFEYDLLGVLGLTRDPAPAQPAEPAPTSQLYGRPALGEIVELLGGALATARAAIADDETALRHELRIAENLARIAVREVESGSTVPPAIAAQLAELGCASEADLAELIRTSVHGVDDTVVDVVNALVQARLRVTDPRRLAKSDED